MVGAGSAEVVPLPPLSALIDDLAATGHELVLVMGKGGVGKTTIAASIAAELASRGLPVHLSTTYRWAAGNGRWAARGQQCPKRRVSR